MAKLWGLKQGNLYMQTMCSTLTPLHMQISEKMILATIVILVNNNVH